jgi:hypothetical protein
MSAIMGAPGPSWEFKKGKPVVLAAGTRFQPVVKTSGAVVRVTQSQGATAAGVAAPAQNAVQSAGDEATKP